MSGGFFEYENYKLNSWVDQIKCENRKNKGGVEEKKLAEILEDLESVLKSYDYWKCGDYGKEEFKDEDKELLEKKTYAWDVSLIEYFKLISDTTFDHCKYEIFSFFDINPIQIKEKKSTLIPLDEAISVKIEETEDRCIIVFRLSAKELLDRSSIKRYHSWLPEGFQRLLIEKKYESPFHIF